jgi:arabinofuranosyltransferase
VGVFGAILGVTLLLSSRAFTDYSTSGLENPLTHLLLAAFVTTWWSMGAGPRRTFWLALLLAAIMTNRIDVGVLVLPAFAVAAWQRPVRPHLIAACAGFVPFAVWELFSLVYYGFLFPNTAYAKLSTGVPQLDLMAQAMHYYAHSLQTDAPTLLTMAAALVLAVTNRKSQTWPLAAGILFYLLYIVRIGGDFMAGRFFAAPFFVAAMVVCRGPLPEGLSVRCGIVATLLLARALLVSAPFDISMPHGITDQRRLYSDGTRLVTQGTSPLEGRPEAIRGRTIRETRPGVVEWGMIGITGYFAGPDVHILDTYALSDPLLARRPANAKWRIGHFERRVPAGYARSLRTGQNHLESKMLAALYDDILLATRGPLWTRARWAAILRLNLP